MLGYDWPHLHAVLNDAPSALLVAAVFFDLLGTLGRRPVLRQVGFWTLLLGAVGAILAVVSGLQAEGRIAHGTAVHEVMEHHEQLAFVTLGVFAVLTLWRLFRESRMGNGERLLSLLVSLAGVGVLVATGRQGGRLVFEHAAGIPSTVLQAELQARNAGHHHGAGAAGDAHRAGEDEDEDHAHTMEPTAPAGAPAPGSHVDPPGTPPHQHDKEPEDHSHSDTTPPHQH